jgi:hypothetical protein
MWPFDLLSKKKAPVYAIYSMDGNTMSIQLDRANLAHPFGVLDGKYQYSDLNGWVQVLGRLKQDKYITEFEDCEDLAMDATLESSETYRLNAIGLAVGSVPAGYHGYCILWVKDIGWMLFEPQSGFGFGSKPFNIGENGYGMPDKVLI